MTSEIAACGAATRWRAGAAARRSLVACLLAAVVAAGCATAPGQSAAPREYLDPATAATVTVGVPTLVFARERPEYAVHARDYLTLVAVDVNRAGKHARYFIGYAWSTIDKPPAAAQSAPSAHFELVADGRRIPLVHRRGSLLELGLGEPPLPAPARNAELLVAVASREEQEFVQHASALHAVLVGEGGSARFDLWRR